MKKKILSLLLASTMVFGLVACGDNTSDADNDTTNDANTDDVQETETKDVELTVWGPQEDQAEENGNWLGTTCDMFNEAHPEWNITFNYGVCAEGDAKDTVTQDVEAAADVYMYANDNISALVGAEGIAKLGGTTVDTIKSTNSDAIVNSVTYDGDVYGVPFTSNTWFMYYDKSVYTEDDIKSLDTMLDKGKVAFPLNNSWYLASFYVANGCTLFGEDGTDEAAGIQFTGDAATAATDYLVDMVANKNFVNDADGVGLSGLADGSINAIFSGSWDAGNVKDALGDNMGVAQLPMVTIDGQEKQLKSFAGSKAIGINPNCDNMEVAVALASYLGSADAQETHYELRSVVPCNTELLAKDEIQADALVVAQNNTFDNTAIIQPFVPAMGNYWSAAEAMGNALINGDVTHDNAATKTEEMNTAMNTAAE